MEEKERVVNLQSIYQWEDMREEILKNRYPNLWDEYKEEEPKKREL